MNGNRTSTVLWHAYLFVAELRWQALVAVIGGHALVAYVGLRLAGEGDLTGWVDFIYFYTTTASTVGYGDLSPSSPAGRLFTAIWIFPGALIIFTTVLAKLTTTFASIWRRRMEGFGDYSGLDGATVIVGHHPQRTRRMIDEIIAGGGDSAPVILVSREKPNFDDERVRFVRGDTLSNKRDLLRAGIASAAKVIVYADDDENTLAAAMAVAAINDSAHLVAYFGDEQKAELLQAHTRAVCVVSQSAELVVREMQDPGASQVMTALSAARTSDTVYSFEVPDGCAADYGTLFDALHREFGATVIARAAANGGEPQFNAARDGALRSGDQVFYIRSTRLSDREIGAALATAPRG